MWQNILTVLQELFLNQRCFKLFAVQLQHLCDLLKDKWESMFACCRLMVGLSVCISASKVYLQIIFEAWQHYTSRKICVCTHFPIIKHSHVYAAMNSLLRRLMRIHSYQEMDVSWHTKQSHLRLAYLFTWHFSQSQTSIEATMEGNMLYHYLCLWCALLCQAFHEANWWYDVQINNYLLTINWKYIEKTKSDYSTSQKQNLVS